MTPSVSQKSGLIRVRVKQTNPDLAGMVLSQVLKLLTDFNLLSHQSQAAAERRFAEQRRDQVHQDLRLAENRLQQFLQENREYRNAPALVFEEERLAREVSTQQQLYTALSQAYEQARMEEVRDTPVFTVIEKPAPPPRPDSRALVFKIFLAICLGLSLALLDIVVRQQTKRQSA